MHQVSEETGNSQILTNYHKKKWKKNLPHHFTWGKALRAGRPWNKCPQLHLTAWGRALISGTTPLLIHYPTLVSSVKKSPRDHHLCPSFLFITASHCTTINKYLENFNACNPNVCIISWTQRLDTIPYSKLGKVGTTRSHQDKLNCFSISLKSPTTKCESWMSPHGKASSMFQVNFQWTNPSMLGPYLIKHKTIYQKNYHHPQMVFL